MGTGARAGHKKQTGKSAVGWSALLDITQDSIIQRYEDRGHQFTSEDQALLDYLKDKIISGDLNLPLVPFYLCKILDLFERQGVGSSPRQGSKTSLARLDVMGDNSFSSMVCRDPALGLHVYHLAKKLFFRAEPKLSYQKVFSLLDWRHFDDLLTLIFHHKPIFSSYRDLPDFQKNWEFASIGALVTTRLAKILELSKADAEEIFLTVLLSDVGKTSLYWELPLRNLADTNNQQRGLRGHPLSPADLEKKGSFEWAVKSRGAYPLFIKADLFREIIWYWHPIVSARIAQDLGVHQGVLNHIIDHHQHLTQADQNLRRVKFVYHVTNLISQHGLCRYERDFDQLNAWNKLFGLNLTPDRVEDFINSICEADFGILEDSVTDPEIAFDTFSTGYQNPSPDSDEKDRFFEPDGLYLQVNLLQLVKDRIHSLTNQRLFPSALDSQAVMEKFARLNLLNAIIVHEDINQAAKALGMLESEVIKQLNALQINP